MAGLLRSRALRIALLLALGALTLAVAGWSLTMGRAGLPAVAIQRSSATPEASTSASPTVAPQTERPGPGTTTVVSPQQAATGFQAGVTVLVYGTDPAFLTKSTAVLDRVARLGANSVSLAYPLFQTNWTSSDIHSDAIHTPTADAITSFVKEAHRRGFKVMLRPLLDEQSLHPNGKWRGAISPSDPGAWFANYGDVVTNYARLAQTNRVEVIDVGTELVSMQPFVSQWKTLIANIRTLYTGQLTYSANWSSPSPAFSTALDFAGVDAFYPLDVPATATTQQLVSAWARWIPQLEELRRSSGHPVVLTELGTTSENGSFQQPWVWSHGTGVNLDTQRRYYAAACLALKPKVTGMYWWDFELDPLAQPSSDIGFVPEGKPAEGEIGKCFA